MRFGNRFKLIYEIRLRFCRNGGGGKKTRSNEHKHEREGGREQYTPSPNKPHTNKGGQEGGTKEREKNRPPSCSGDSTDKASLRKVELKLDSSRPLLVGGIDWDAAEAMLAPEPTPSLQEAQKRDRKGSSDGSYYHCDIDDAYPIAKEKEASPEEREAVRLGGAEETKGPPQACLFVASLSPDTPEDALHDFFSRYGEVLKIKLMKDRSSRPYAFVQYSNAEDANNALHHANSATLAGRRLRVEKAKVNRTLFIAKMNRSLTNQKLRETAEVYGPVESVTIIKNHQTQKSKGCGFVKFQFREDAMDAYLGLKNQFRKWVIEWATSANDPDSLGVDKYNIFVGGLNPKLVTKEGIEDRFKQYGAIDSVTLINRDEQNLESVRSAFAFIRFRDESSSAAAIEHENGTEWLGRRIRVQYCESMEMKTKRRTQKYFAAMNPYLALPNNAYYQGLPYSSPLMMPGAMHPMYQSHGMATTPVNISPYYERKAYPHTTDMQHLYPGPFSQNVYPFAPGMLPYEAQPWAYGPIHNAEDESVENAENENYHSFGQGDEVDGASPQEALAASFGAMGLDGTDQGVWQQH